jgi:hypothetical protein
VKRQTFSRYNQPRHCRICGKLTTWSEANGHGGLDLCQKCFDAATIQNEHYDGYHNDVPKADCPLCRKEVK